MPVIRTNRDQNRLLAIALALAASPGCLPGAPVANAVAATMWGEQVEMGTEPFSSSALPITSSALRGDIGTVTGLDGQNGRVNSYAETEFDFSTVDVSIIKPDGTAGMVILNLSGLFADLETAPSGVYRANAYGEDVIIDDTGDSYTQIDGSEDELPSTENDRVDVTLCSGEALDNWDYDAPADNVVVEIEEPIAYEADPEACPDCAPITTRRVTFLTETSVDDGFGNFENRRATGAFTLLMGTSAAAE
jgi:hypothetical protein